MSISADGLQAPPYLLRVLAAVERGYTHVAFSAGTEAAAGGNDDVKVAQHAIEQLPTGYTLRGLQPDVRRVRSAKRLHSGTFCGVDQNTGVFHVIIDEEA